MLSVLVDNDDVIKIVIDYFRVMETGIPLIKAFLLLSPEEGGDCVICYDGLENGGGLKCAECRNVFHGGFLGAALSMNETRCLFVEQK